MSSNFVRLGLLAGLAVLLAGVIAWAQDRRDSEPTGRNSTHVFNGVEGRTVVITSLPEGTRVEKGDIVCELDPSELRDRLLAEEILVRAAEADVNAARIGREVAVLTVIEYKEGTFVQDFAQTESEIKLIEAKLAGAEDQTEWSRRMFEKGYVSMSEKVVNELALKQARFALEQAQSKKKVLIDYSKARTIKALTGAVEAARAGELAKQADLERKRSVQKRLNDQIGRCKVKAPATGRITYAAPLGTGAVVHDGQLLGRVVAEGRSRTTPK
jgi:HlyD family secretion protein